MRISNREKRFKLTTEHVEYSKYMDLFQEAHTVSMRERERERARERERESFIRSNAEQDSEAGSGPLSLEMKEGRCGSERRE